MSSLDIIRAWKDEDYRLSLTDAQRAMLPSSPVGLIELSDIDMSTLAGGMGGVVTPRPRADTATGKQVSMAHVMPIRSTPASTAATKSQQQAV